MLCKGKISNGEPRVGNRMESQFYEGIQTRWMHLTCALKTRKVTRITQLEGWDRMGYDVNLEIRECTGQALSDAKEKELKTTMEALEGVQDLLCLNMTHADLVAALKLNGVNAADLLIEGDSIAMAVLLADYLAHGIPQDCPVCGNSSLSFSAGRITCWGYVDGLSKCQHKAQSCQRYKFSLNLYVVSRGAKRWRQTRRPSASRRVGRLHAGDTDGPREVGLHPRGPAADRGPDHLAGHAGSRRG
jgi:hypothetical protein